MTEQEISAVRNDYKAHLEAELGNVASFVPKVSILQEHWAGITWPTNDEADHNPATGVDNDTLIRVGKASIAAPDGFVSVMRCSPAQDGLILFMCRKFIPNCIDTSPIA